MQENMSVRLNNIKGLRSDPLTLRLLMSYIYIYIWSTHS